MSQFTTAAATGPPPPPSPPPRPRRPHRGFGIALVIVAGFSMIASLVLFAAGGALMWADRTQRDATGYLTSPTQRLSGAEYALATTNLDVALAGPTWHVSTDALGWVRISARAAPSAPPVFLGLAARNDVLRYLDGVAYAEPTNLVGDVTYRGHPGGPPRTAPTAQSFWQAKASGTGTQTVTWKLAPGQWAIVLMNADASRGVAADVSVGATVPVLFALALGLLIGGAAALLVGVLLLVWGVLSLRGTSPPRLPTAGPLPWGAGSAPPAGWGAGDLTYPLRLEGHLDQPVSRWLWLVKWFLLIPHLLVLALLWVAVSLLTLVAFFAILFTGRYPRPIFDFNVGVLRWWWRVLFYGCSALGTDRYPPFSLRADVDYPATLEVPYPARLSRGLVLVKWWLLAIPQYLVLGLLGSGSSHGLIALLVVVAAIVLLFTARYPADLFNLIVGLNRWFFRVLVYVLLMRDEYPPFRLDLGGTEPGASTPPPRPLTQPQPHRA